MQSSCVDHVPACPPLYCPGATRPRKACSRLTSRFRVASYCRRVDLVCVYARRPLRTLRSHDFQRASRKLSVHAVVLCASGPPYPVQTLCARGKLSVVLPHAFGLQAIVAGWTWCATSTASAAAARLRRQRCTARRIGGCDRHCDDNDAQHDRFSHGRRGRDVRYARTIINAHHVS
jgi:hypothetical protein